MNINTDFIIKFIEKNHECSIFDTEKYRIL